MHPSSQDRPFRTVFVGWIVTVAKATGYTIYPLRGFKMAEFSRLSIYGRFHFSRGCFPTASPSGYDQYCRINLRCRDQSPNRTSSIFPEPSLPLVLPVLPGRYPMESEWKCFSNSGSRRILTTIRTIQSETVGIPKGRVFPPAFGIYTLKTGGGK